MKSILWVEDEEDQYAAFSYFLETDYKIERAIDFEDAKHKANSKQYDLIIVDIIIPSGKKATSIEELLKIKEIYFGLELIKKLREQGIKTKIIVVTVVREEMIWNEIKSVDPNINIVCKYDSEPKQVTELVNTII